VGDRGLRQLAATAMDDPLSTRCLGPFGSAFSNDEMAMPVPETTQREAAGVRRCRRAQMQREAVEALEDSRLAHAGRPEHTRRVCTGG